METTKEQLQNENTLILDYIRKQSKYKHFLNCINIPSPEAIKWCNENNVDIATAASGIMTYILKYEEAINNFEYLCNDYNSIVEEYLK